MVIPVMAYIGLGSNLAGPEQQVQQACVALAALPQCRLLHCSSLYRSMPLRLEGVPLEADASVYALDDQPDYINAVVALETGLTPLALLDALQQMELDSGRDRNGPRWGPRTLDLDILLYGQHIIDEPRLCVPHPGLAEREFVLYPLYQIAPQLVLPDGQRLKDRVAVCPLRGLQRLSLAELEVN